jgi:hypothetical protein
MESGHIQYDFNGDVNSDNHTPIFCHCNNYKSDVHYCYFDDLKLESSLLRFDLCGLSMINTGLTSLRPDIIDIHKMETVH